MGSCFNVQVKWENEEITYEEQSKSMMAVCQSLLATDNAWEHYHHAQWKIGLWSIQDHQFGFKSSWREPSCISYYIYFYSFCCICQYLCSSLNSWKLWFCVEHDEDCEMEACRQQCKFMRSPKTLALPWLWTWMEYQRLVWILLVLTVWSLHWLLREKHVLSLPLQTKSHFFSTKICATMFVKHFQVLPPSLIPLRVP